MPRWPRQKCGAEGEESRTRPSRRRRRSAPTARTGGSHAQRYTRVYTRAPRRSLGRPSRSVGFLPGLPPRRSTGARRPRVACRRMASRSCAWPLLRWTQLTEETGGRKSSGWRPPLPTPLSKRVGAPTSFPRSGASAGRRPGRPSPGSPRLGAKLEVRRGRGFSSRCRPRVLRLVARDRRAYSKSHEQPHGQDPQVAPARQEVLTSPGRAKTRGRRFRGVDWLDWPCGQNPVGSPKAAHAVRRTRR